MHSSEAGHRCALCHVPARYAAVRADPPVALSPVWTTGGEHGKDGQVIGNSTERVYITTEGDMLADLADFFSGDSAHHQPSQPALGIPKVLRWSSR